MPLNKRGRAKEPVETVETAPPRAIFRAEALDHYVQNQEKLVLPHLVSPRSFILLWIVATIVLAIGLYFAVWPWLGRLADGVI